MSILIPSTEPGVFQEPEIPTTYNQGLEAWEESEGYAYNKELEAWEERWSPIKTILVNRESFYTVVRANANGSSNSISFGSDCATIAMHKAADYYSQPEGLLSSKTTVRVKPGDTIAIRYKINSYSAYGSGAEIYALLSRVTVGSDRTINAYAYGYTDSLFNILFPGNYVRIGIIKITADYSEKIVKLSVPDDWSGDFYINLALIWNNTNENSGNVSATFYDVTII